MKQIADLHIHSRYSMATSKDGTPEMLDLWARKKGITILGTGDMTHPVWRQELKDKLGEGNRTRLKIFVDPENVVQKRDVCYGMLDTNIDNLVVAQQQGIPTVVEPGFKEQTQGSGMTPQMRAQMQLNWRREGCAGKYCEARPHRLLGVVRADLFPGTHFHQPWPGSQGECNVQPYEQRAL